MKFMSGRNMKSMISDVAQNSEPIVGRGDINNGD
jgi:hypothetical protein